MLLKVLPFEAKFIVESFPLIVYYKMLFLILHF
jgi:hypothetical protein